VRNFLRSGVQEVAHLAGGHELRGLQRLTRVKTGKSLRNFLRTCTWIDKEERQIKRSQPSAALTWETAAHKESAAEGRDLFAY
jgi:hypothetical protein